MKPQTIKVLSQKPCLEIDGIKFHHHPNGGGLVAETAHVSARTHIGPFTIALEKTRVTGKARINVLKTLVKKIKVLSQKPCLKIDGVKFHHHSNGGGLVAETAHVSATAHVGLFALVYERARVLDKAEIYDLVEIRGHATVCDDYVFDGDIIVESHSWGE